MMTMTMMLLVNSLTKANQCLAEFFSINSRGTPLSKYPVAEINILNHICYCNWFLLIQACVER